MEERENGVSDEQIVGYVLSAGRSDVAGQQPFFGVSIEISDTSKSFPSPISIELTFLSRFQTWLKQPRDPGVVEKSAVNLRDF